MPANPLSRASGTATYDFDVPLDRSALSTMKWEAEIARKNDADLLCLGIAEMDFHAAPPVLRALRRVVEGAHFGYPLKRSSYYDAITGYFARQFAWQIEPAWIAGNVGIYPAMNLIIEELSAIGDDIIFQTPGHHIFPEIIQAAGRVPVCNPLIEHGGRYEMDWADLERKITSRTKLFMLCSPHNPVGRVWTRAELTRLNEICFARDVIVVTDEVYCGLIYPGVQFTPFAAVSRSTAMNSLTLVSASKSFNLTGLKHSLVIAQNPLLRSAYMRGLKRTNLYFSGDIFGQAATEAAFHDCDDWTTALMAYLQGNLEHARAFIRTRLPEIRATLPEATYFLWLDCRGLELSDKGLCAFFEDRARVSGTMGAPLGEGGAGHVRINLATQRSILDAALHRIADARDEHHQTS